MSDNKTPAFNASRSAADEEREVRELLRGAGPRPAVPVDELAPIRAAAKASWQQAVRMESERSRFRTRRTAFALAASLLLVVAVGWWMKPQFGTAPAEAVASVDRVRGVVTVAGHELVAGFDVLDGSVVETGDSAGSRVALRLADGQSVRLDVGTRVRVGAGSRLDLERGGLYIDTADSLPGVGVEVSTPFGMVRDIGTQFEVRMGDANTARLLVRVREGEVALERGVESHSAKAGEQLTLEGESVGRATILPSASSWSWIAEVTPSMNVEGATLAAYLEWVSRETGRHLEYSERALADSSEGILVHGSIEGMTPEESLDVVLPSSGLGYQVDNGSLVIKRPVL